MAGKSVGTIFVELDLDTDRYTRAQKTLLKDATTTSLSIEKNFKNLGVKSSAEMDLMRQKVMNSFNMIANSSKATANDIMRAEEAKNAKLKQLNEQQYGVHKSFLTKMKTDYAVLWTAVAAGAVAAGYVMANVAKESISAASKLEEVTSKFNVVFKDQQKEAEKWATTLVDGFAMSTRESKQYLSSIQDLLVPMGMTSNEAGKLSFEVVKLSADLGSFNNMPTATVMRDIESALVGNFETMKKYGVVLNETVVAQQAMAMGFGETKKEIDASEKAQAAYALMVKGSTVAIGDQQRTMGSYANQLKQWNANVEELTGLLGNELLPVATEYLKALNDWVKVNDELIKQKVPEYVENAVTAIKALAKAVEFVSKAISKSTGFSTLLDIYALLAKANEDLEKGSNVVWGKIPKQVSVAATDVETSGNVIITKFSDLVKEWEELNEVAGDFNDIWDEAFDIDYGTDPVLAAIQERELAINNLNFATRQAIDLQNAMTGAADDTYDADYDGQNLSLQAAVDSQNELNESAADGSKLQTDQLNSYINLFGQLAGMQDDQSDAIMAMEIASQGLAIVSAVIAIATQGSGDPYTAFARIAAMSASMAGLLSSAGISFSGAGSSAGGALLESTVLGAAAGTASESTTDVLDLLEDIHADEYETLEGIYEQVQNLNENITGLVTEIVRFGDLASFTLPDAVMSPQMAFWTEWQGSLGDVGLITPIEEMIGSVFGDIGQSIFGGAQEVDLTGYGIAISSATIDYLLSGGGLAANVYGKITTTTDGGWFGSDSEDTDTVYQELDAGITDMFTQIFAGIGETLFSLAEVFGTDMNQVFDYIFEDLIIDLYGMDADEINTALTEFFSGQADVAAEALFGSFIGKYQELGEGMYETAIRVASEYAIVMDIMDETGVAFGTGAADTNMYMVDLSQTLIELAGGLESLTESASAYYDAFFTDEEKYTRLQDQLSDAMENLNLALPDTREGFRELVEGLDLSTEAGQAAYIALLAMAESAGIYYDAVEDTAQAAEDAALALDNLVLSVAGLQAAALGMSTSYTLSSMASTYGFDPNLSPTELAARAESFLSTASADDIIELAESVGVDAEQLIADAEWLMNLAENTISPLNTVIDAVNEWLGAGSTFDFSELSVDNMSEYSAEIAQIMTDKFNDLQEQYSDWEGLQEQAASIVDQYQSVFDDTNVMDRIPELLDQSLEGVTSWLDDMSDWVSDALSLYADLSSTIKSIQDMMTVKPDLTIEALTSEINSGLAGLSGMSIEEQINAALELADMIQQRYDMESEAIAEIETTVENLKTAVESISKKIVDLKYSSFNLALPTETATLAAGDYATYLAGARTGDPELISDYLAFVDTYLQESMDAYKSSEEYQRIYAQVTDDLLSLGVDANNMMSIEEMTLDSINVSTSEMVDALGSILDVLLEQQEDLRTVIEDSTTGVDEIVVSNLEGINTTIQDGIAWVAELLSGDIYTALLTIAGGLSSETGVIPESFDIAAMMSDLNNFFNYEEFWGKMTPLQNGGAIILDAEGFMATYLDPGGQGEYSFTNDMSMEEIYAGSKLFREYLNSLYLNDGYADGGISYGSDSGHLELLHGTEAIIPIGDGGVPVKFLDGGSSKSVTVNVYIDGEKISVREIQTVADELVTVKALRGVLDKRIVM